MTKPIKRISQLSQVKLRHSSFPANNYGGPKQTDSAGREGSCCGPRRPGLGACAASSPTVALVIVHGSLSHTHTIIWCLDVYVCMDFGVLYACAHVQLHVCREATCTMSWVEDGEEQRVWILNDCCS